ncbi:MAG: hypothetical protein ACF8XB_23095 [Planctomycetota bacterium JB042]
MPVPRRSGAPPRTETTRLPRGRLVPLALALLGVLASSVAADVVHLKNGGKLHGEILSDDGAFVEVKTKFGVQKIAKADVKEIERKRTPAQEIDDRLGSLAADDADGVFALAVLAEERRLRKRHRELLDRVLEIDPEHDGANRALGRVKYKGTWVRPEERERLEQESRAEQMRAQGMVEHDGRWVTPEEKEKLEQGLVLHEGEWLPEDEARRRQGWVEVNGRWVRGEDHWVAETRAEVSKVIGKPLSIQVSDHVAVYTDIEGDFGKKLAELLEKGHRKFAREFDTGPGLGWLGGRRVDVFAFRLRFAYEKFVTWVGAERGMGVDWGERAKRVVSVYRYDDTWAMGAVYMANKGEAQTAAHCANMVGHILVNRYGYEGQKLPPFFDESFAALFEFDLLGRNSVFTLGAGRYERSVQKDEMKFFEDGQWGEALRDAMRKRDDTPLENAVRRDFSDLVQMDVAKGMALFQRWRSLGDGTLKVFFDTLRERWPPGDLPPGHVQVLEAIVHAVHAVEPKDLPVVDQEIRKFAMRMKDPVKKK